LRAIYPLQDYVPPPNWGPKGEFLEEGFFPAKASNNFLNSPNGCPLFNTGGVVKTPPSYFGGAPPFRGPISG